MAQISNTMSFHVSSNQAERINALMVTRKNKTPVEMINQIIEMGIYQLEYRGKMNKQNAQLKKVGRKTMEMINSGHNIKAMRDMAIGLGLVVDNNDDDDIVSVE